MSSTNRAVIYCRPLFLLAALAFFVTPLDVQAGQRVVLRQTKGNEKLAPRFYQPLDNDRPQPTGFFPRKKDRFEIMPVIARGGPNKSGSPATIFRDPNGWPFAPGRATLLYDYHETPPALRKTLSSLVQGLAAREIHGKPYDKKRVKKKEEYIWLPAPTLRDWKRKKRHRILATQEEYRITAEPDGEIEIRVAAMPYLKLREKWTPPGAPKKKKPDKKPKPDADKSSDKKKAEQKPKEEAESLLMFVIDAKLPAKGHVWYKIPSVLNVATGYRTTIEARVVAELRITRDGRKVRLARPEVLDVDVRLKDLDLSNDILAAARGPIRDFINEEARRKEIKLREKANKAVRKAVKDRSFKIPLLNYLLP